MKVLKLEVTHELIGSKALNLKVIKRSGCKVPETFVLFNNHINSRMLERSKGTIIRDIEESLSEDKLYAVRSAKGIEDSREDSFAGIFKSVLNVKKKNIYEALEEVAKSYDHVVFKTKAQPYDLLNIDHSRIVKDAILIQEMITPKYSGVLFSKNPVNNEDEMMVEMVLGLGDQLDQEGIDPIRASFKEGILTYDDRLIEEDAKWLKQVFKEAIKIKKQFGGAIDCEWVYDGADIYWLQVRPVTALSTTNVFDHSIAKGYLPEVIKPLEFDMITVTSLKAWLKLAKEIDEHVDVDDTSILRSYYGRPYFNHQKISRILDTIGLDPKDVEVFVQFDGENFKSSFTLLPKAFFHTSGWIDFYINRRKRIKHSSREVTLKKEIVNKLKNQLKTEQNKNAFMSIYFKVKELYLECEYLNILIRVGPFNTSKKYNKELEFIKEVKQDCYACIHECGLKFGNYLVDLGYLNDEKDIMYISEDILLNMVHQKPNSDEITTYIKEQKLLFKEHQNSILPKLIYGEENPILQRDCLDKKTITGLPMSKGRSTGRVRFITIDDELESVKPGEIVILPYADMVFEPVLMNASGLLLKTGGVLSHLAILAREHYVPAITGISQIEDLKEGMLIAIDAYTGVIIIMEN